MNLIAKNYKEPLLRVNDGFGYMGTISMTEDGDKIQCHICGELFFDLNPHILKKHNIKTREYKEKYGIAYLTALISESERWRRKDKTMKWLQSLTPAQLADLRQRTREGGIRGRNNRNHGAQPKGTLEAKNKRGTCPDQLIDRIKKNAKELGRRPTLAEFIALNGSQRFKHKVFDTFGSWNNALKLAGLSTFSPKQHPGKKKGILKYSNDELLERLRVFVEMEGRIPTSTDCRTNALLPSESAYTRAFGSLPKARDEAGLEGLPQSDKEFQDYVLNMSK